MTVLGKFLPSAYFGIYLAIVELTILFVPTFNGKSEGSIDVYMTESISYFCKGNGGDKLDEVDDEVNGNGGVVGDNVPDEPSDTGGGVVGPVAGVAGGVVVSFLIFLTLLLVYLLLMLM